MLSIENEQVRKIHKFKEENKISSIRLTEYLIIWHSIEFVLSCLGSAMQAYMGLTPVQRLKLMGVYEPVAEQPGPEAD